jgi:glycyl-tRNA synthetase (class II)
MIILLLFRPMGCAMKANILAAWRNYFVLEEHMLEVTNQGRVEP